MQTRLDRFFKKKKRWHEVGLSERWIWEELGGERKMWEGLGRGEVDMGGAREGRRGYGRG